MRVHGHYGGTGQIFPAFLLNKRILVTGGRGYGDGRTVDAVLDALRPVRIIQGGAGGADAFAAGWAHRSGVTYVTVPIGTSAWDRSKRAGHDRNQRMLDEEEVDLVVAFPGGRGTADMVARAERAALRVIRVDNDGPTDFMTEIGA